MGALKDSIRRAFVGSAYRPVSAPLPVECVVNRRGRFSFGLPWPWEEVDVGEGLVDATGEAVPTAILAFVRAPRTDGAQVSFSVWAEPSKVKLDQGLSAFPREFSGLYGARPINARRLALGGAPTVLVQMATHNEAVARLVAEWHDRSLHGEFRVPLYQREQYWPQFETILGTWSWD